MKTKLALSNGLSLALLCLELFLKLSKKLSKLYRKKTKGAKYEKKRKREKIQRILQQNCEPNEGSKS